MISRSTDVKAALRYRNTSLRSRQRGLINPYILASSCASNGFEWSAATVSSPEATITNQFIVGGSGSRILALSQVGSVVNYVYTTDDGVTWTRRTFGTSLDFRNLVYVSGDIWIAPLGNSSPNSVSRRTTDGGVTWSNVTHGASGYYYGSAANPSGSVIRYVRYNDTATVVSTNQGASFSAGPSMPGSQTINSLTYHADKWYAINSSNNTIYVLNETTGTWSTWDKFTSVKLSVLISPGGGAFFAVEQTGQIINVSLDNGVTWIPTTGTSSWCANRATTILYHPDGFYFAGSRASTTVPLSLHASVNGINWFNMGTSVAIPSGETLVRMGIISSLGIIVAGSTKATNTMFKGEC